ncbi:hypothetical protein CEE45_11810 [Candidatus Heimdallarchaeota archaeon B3_Heim]|nr:MAG: hypothetical protein CEE45_11810 [Candidatus Heimdallarchaeota archaeon B3_Heim]
MSSNLFLFPEVKINKYTKSVFNYILMEQNTMPRPVKRVDTESKEKATEDAEKNKDTVPISKHY